MTLTGACRNCTKLGRTTQLRLQTKGGRWFWCPRCDAHAVGCHSNACTGCHPKTNLPCRQVETHHHPPGQCKVPELGEPLGS